MNALILPRDDDNQHMTFEGKRVVLLDRDGEYYREWRVTVAGTQYCIICEGDIWTLMYCVPDVGGWCDAPDDVDAFLTTHKLILAS